MSFLVKCISPRGASVPKTVETQAHVVNNWAPGQIDKVDDSLINLYSKSTDVFTILGKSGVVGSATGLATVSGLSAVNSLSDSGVNQTNFTLSNMAQAVVQATAAGYGGTQLYTFPLGLIQILGVVATFGQKTTSVLASTLNASSAGYFAIGSAAASSGTMTSTMVSVLAAIGFTSSATINVAGSNVSGETTDLSQLDGTGTAAALFLNTGYAAGVSGAATQILSGHFTITWLNLGIK